MVQKFIFNKNYCHVYFKPNVMLQDGTITDIKLYHSDNQVINDVETVFEPSNNSLQLITSVFIPLMENDSVDENKSRKLVYIHLTKENTNYLNMFLKDKEDYYG